MRASAIAKLLRDFEAHSTDVLCLSIGRKSGLVLATGGEDRRINLWSMAKQQALVSLSGHTSPVTCVAFDGNEDVLLAGSAGGTNKLWDIEQQKVVRTLVGHKSVITAVDFHPHGEYFASGSQDTTVKFVFPCARASFFPCRKKFRKKKLTAPLVSLPHTRRVCQSVS
jgi:katanin p80 WD40 repeat-containing subunit B1